jgi:DNA repair protein RadC
MSIKHWPQAERPREKLLARGAAALSEAELLAILLRSGTRGVSAVDLARGLLSRFGGLRALLSCDAKQFCALPGLGEASWAQLQAVLEISRRHYAEKLDRGDGFTNPRQVCDYLRACLRDRPNEVFCVMLLDNRHRMIRFIECFQGTIDSATVHPREIVRLAIQHNAAAAILAHNHPSGVAEPSEADIALTRHLQRALALVDVRVIDHFVVGDGQPTSFAERGLL